jgi:hypothetical protein
MHRGPTLPTVEVGEVMIVPGGRGLASAPPDFG